MRIVFFLSGGQLVWGPPLVQAPLYGDPSVGAPFSGGLLGLGPFERGHLEWGLP
jgi:hypothetical protein